MANKKKITLRDLYDLLEEEDALTKRVTLFFATDGGIDEDDSNEVWLSGEIGLAFSDWIVTSIGYAKGGLEIIIDKPEGDDA